MYKSMAVSVPVMKEVLAASKTLPKTAQDARRGERSGRLVPAGTALVRGQRTNSRVARVVRGLTGASWIGADVAELRHLRRAGCISFTRAFSLFSRTVVTGNAAQVVVQKGRSCGTGTMRARSAGGVSSIGNAVASHPKNRARPRQICRASTRRSSQDPAAHSRPTGGTAEPSGA